MNPYIITCESTVDLPYSFVERRHIPVIFYSYSIEGKEYADDMQRDPTAMRRFYAYLEEGKVPRTSQLNAYAYEEFFEENLKQGDILHIAFGSGMTQSVHNAERAAESLKEKYPDRKIIVIDSLCSSTGYGMLVDYAADLRDAGDTIEKVADWVLLNRQRIHHQFFSHRLDYYRRSGRISGPAAALGTLLNICPIMRLNAAGKIVAYDKVRGKKKAIATTLEMMEQHAEKGKAYSGKCYVCHSDCLEEAQMTKEAVVARFPNITGDVQICDIGTIIASHCGPGTVAVFFVGDDR